MHDIGKIGIPDRILQNPGRLDGDDLRVMQSHARIGYDMLKEALRLFADGGRDCARVITRVRRQRHRPASGASTFL